MPAPNAVMMARISSLASIRSSRARSTFRILPRSGRIAWKRRSRPCLAEPPLYRVSHGKESHWVYSDQQKDMLVKDLSGNGKEPGIQRYKGLGEMNPEQLWESTMNPATRTILQVAVEDAVAADETFDMLMGDQVPPRKRFIQTHAKDVRNLDV